jgi:drug/metabolite transporter (DMT)-like permease
MSTANLLAVDIKPGQSTGETSQPACQGASSVSYLWLPATLIAASIEPIIVKLGYADHCSPFQLLWLKSMVGAMVICPLTRQYRWIGIAGFLKILPVALLLLCTGALTLSSLQYIQASSLITIMTVTPAAVALVNQALGRDILEMKFWIGFFMCAAGLFLTTRTEFVGLHIAGLMLAFAAVLSSTSYRVLLEKVTQTYKPALVSTYIFLINGLCLLPFYPMLATNLSPNIIARGLWLGVAAAIANVAFLYAISLLGSTRVSIITMLERPIVIVIAALVLKDTLSIIQICGIILVFVGVQLAKVRRKSDQYIKFEARSVKSISAGDQRLTPLLETCSRKLQIPKDGVPFARCQPTSSSGLSLSAPLE